MTKNDLADKLAAATGLGVGESRGAVDALLDAVSDELAAGNEVSLAGFGKFSISHRPARQGRNPATGDTIDIAASNNAKFSPASALKKRLNP